MFMEKVLLDLTIDLKIPLFRLAGTSPPHSCTVTKETTTEMVEYTPRS